MNQKINNIVQWLNKNYNQNSENYSVFNGAKPEVIRLDDETAISLWGCGAIVCIGDSISFISEDDGHWFYNDGNQTPFSIGWVKSFSDAMIRLDEYVRLHGEPVYFSGVEPKEICHFKLVKES